MELRERIARAIERCDSIFVSVIADAVLAELGQGEPKAEPVGETAQWEGSDCVRWYDESKTLPVGTKLYTAPQPQPLAEPVLPTITQDEAREFQRWKGMDGAIAYHLIERHADNWADVGVMMNAWLEANAAPQGSVATTPQALPEAMTEEKARSVGESLTWAVGWNACREAMLAAPQPQASAEDVAAELYEWMVGRLPNGDLLNASVVCDHAGAVAFKRELAERIRASLGVGHG